MRCDVISRWQGDGVIGHDAFLRLVNVTRALAWLAKRESSHHNAPEAFL